MHEVGGAVQGVDDPPIFCCAGRISGQQVLLAEHGMVRKRRQNRLSSRLPGRRNRPRSRNQPALFPGRWSSRPIDGSSGRRSADGGSRRCQEIPDLAHFCLRLYEAWRQKNRTKLRNSRCGGENSCPSLYKTEKLGIIKIDGFGLFSVPAPPFHFPVSGGVFLFTCAGVPPSAVIQFRLKPELPAERRFFFDLVVCALGWHVLSFKRRACWAIFHALRLKLRACPPYNHFS